MISPPVLLRPSKPVEAGSWGTWKLLFTVPAGGIDDGGSIRIALRFASDWARPQMVDGHVDHYLTVHCSRPETRLITRWMDRGHVRPYMSHLSIEILDTPLLEGDTLGIIFGDVLHGGRGTRAQSFVQDKFDFQIHVDRFGTGIFDPVAHHPGFQIVAGKPAHLLAFAKGSGTRLDPVRLLIRAEDVWGNPIRRNISGAIKLHVAGGLPGFPRQIRLKQGRWESRLVIPSGAGPLKIMATHARLGTCRSNPIFLGNSILRHYWGDLHGQSGETIGSNTARQYFVHARDDAYCDFVGHQGNDFQITDAFWKNLQSLSRTFTKEGRFIVFPGYEWSGLTAMGGDHNVLYLKENQPIRRCSTVQVRGQVTQSHDVSPLPALYHAIHHSRQPALLIPHVGGRRANLDFHDPQLERVIEIHSCWGTFEWFYHEALRRGYRLGVVANSDGHKGRPGHENPGAGKFGVFGGLTCILAPTLSREDLFHALSHRHCYGTSGPRILVNARLDGQIMGSDMDFPGKPLPLLVEVCGMAPIERMDLLCAGHPVASWTGSPYPERPRRQIRIRWSGARILNRNRAACWDGQLQVLGNHILAAEGFAFDSPVEGITHRGRTSVQWKSITTGDEDGLLLTLARGLRGTLQFKTGILEREIHLARLATRPIRLSAGGVRQQVIFELAPDAARLKDHVVWNFSAMLQKKMAVRGQIPLHLRVTQLDGHRAWTSPWFIHTVHRLR